MLDELLPIIVEVLIANRQEATLAEISEFCGYDSHEVTKALNLLKGLSLVRDADHNGVTRYHLVKNIKPIHLARAAQVGLDLASFNDFFSFTDKEKAMALELTARSDQLRNLDISKRKPLLQKRGYLKVDKVDDISSNLLLFFESTNSALYDYVEGLSKNDPHLQLLISLNNEAESSLKNYLDSVK